MECNVMVVNSGSCRSGTISVHVAARIIHGGLQYEEDFDVYATLTEASKEKLGKLLDHGEVTDIIQHKGLTSNFVVEIKTKVSISMMHICLYHLDRPADSSKEQMEKSKLGGNKSQIRLHWFY